MKCTKLIYKSPVFGSVQCEELPSEDSRCIDFGPRTAMRLYEKGPEVELFLTEHTEDLAFAVPEELEGLVVKAVFGQTAEDRSELYLLTEIYVRKEPTEQQHQQIVDWIEGQMSDGWGEGLEQHEAYEQEVCYDIVDFDDDECEFDTTIRSDVAYFYLHPWANDISWRVELIDREEAELDIEEPDKYEEIRTTLLKVKELIDEIAEELKNVT